MITKEEMLQDIEDTEKEIEEYERKKKLYPRLKQTYKSEINERKKFIKYVKSLLYK